MKKQIKNGEGQALVQALIFGSIAVYVLGGLVVLAIVNVRASKYIFNREQAIQIAEAGVDYYRWHLAHAPTDYQDGTGGPGPYVHDFFDKNGSMIGQFSLDIEAPLLGSTLVTIRSTGTVLADSSISRVITTRLAKPSFAKYAWVLNSFVSFGSAAEVFGPVHSNAGLRFDGLAHNLVTSAVAAFDDPDHSGGNEFGVHTHSSPQDPLPPSAVPPRPDVFQIGRQFPVPAVDFAGITADLSQMKTDAQNGGHYFAGSGALGYHIILRTNDTFDIYRVNNLMPPPSNCSSGGVTGWGTWSIATGGETFLQNYPLPANGIIFVEDHVWVNGQIDSARLTIASGRFPDSPSTRTNIIVNNDLLYTNYGGQDVVGLIAQGNFNVGLISENDLRIDAAIMAQNGRVGRFSYSSSYCGPERTRSQLTTHGMLGSNGRSVFVYGSSNGYQSRTYVYDANLLYGPPPSFPLTSEQYITISWEEE